MKKLFLKKKIYLFSLFYFILFINISVKNTIASELLFKPLETEAFSEKNFIRKTQKISVNFNLLSPGHYTRISLPLGNKNYDIALTPLESEKLALPKDQSAWTGILNPATGDSMFLLRGRNFIRAHITLNGMIYEIHSIEGAQQTLELVNPALAFPRDHPMDSIQVVNGGQTVDPNCADTPEKIDLMVVFTSATLAAAGSLSALEAEIYFAVAQANLAYFNSNVFHRLNLINITEAPLYTEPASGFNSNTALSHLRSLPLGTGDALDFVHALRDQYKADLVMLVAENLFGNDGAPVCGSGRVIDPASASSDQDGFSVATRACLGGNYTLAHETGHNLSARHDKPAYTPTAPSSTTNYNWGHIEPSPVGGATPWRTVMAYNTAPCGLTGSTYCQRLPYFSNPSVYYMGDPTGDINSLGTPTSALPIREDNVQAMANNAGIVAKFRCRSLNNDADVWMKDTWQDTGLEPDPATASQNMWESPYIWTRLQDDSNYNNEHLHQNPVYGQTNYMYVKAHNDGVTSETGSMELYWANASTNLNNSENWNLIGSSTDAIDAGTKIFKFPWSSLPGTGHYCLLARWNTSGSALSFTDVNSYTRGSKHVVWRNMNIVNVSSTAAPLQTYTMLVRGTEDPAWLVFSQAIPNQVKVPWEKITKIKISLKDKAQADYFSKLDHQGLEQIDKHTYSLKLNGQAASLGPFNLKKGEELPIIIDIEVDANSAKEAQSLNPNGAVLNLAINQTIESALELARKNINDAYAKEGLIIGGVSYLFTISSAESK